MSAFSGYRFMWMFVMFDLPVVTKRQRKRATKFRHDLLDLGFQMAQYSIYIKFCGQREAANALAGRIERRLPSLGRVSILIVTDKQYERMRVFNGRQRQAQEPSQRQLVLF